MLGNKVFNKFYQRVLHTIDIPDDLNSITDIDTENEVPAKEAGLESTAVENIWQCTEELYRKGAHPLLSICVRRQGKIILNRSIGYIDGVRPGTSISNPRIASINTPVCLFSASKFVSAMLIHILAEQGKLNLLDPISYYIPEFAHGGKGNITIYQLLSHRGGVPSVNEEAPVDAFFDHDEALKYVCSAKPIDVEGRLMAYHAITSGILIDELIRVTTGLTAQQYLDKVIRKPLKMRYFRYGLDESDFSSIARNEITGAANSGFINEMLFKALGLSVEDAIKISNEERFLRSIAPSANLCATAEETSRFFQLMLNHGRWEGKNIFSPLTLLRATREVGKTRIDQTLHMPMRYSAGAMLGGKPVGFFGRNSHHAYGHIGLSNIFCWADPERDIAVAILNSGKPVIGPHIAALFKLINTIASECYPIVDMHSDVPIYKKYMATKKKAG